MLIKDLMLDLSLAMGGISKHKGDFWILEVPIGSENVVVYFKLNNVVDEHSDEQLLVVVTQIGKFSKNKDKVALRKSEYLLSANIDLRFSRTALMGNKIVLLAVVGMSFSEESILEIVHEICYGSKKFKNDLKNF